MEEMQEIFENEEYLDNDTDDVGEHASGSKSTKGNVEEADVKQEQPSGSGCPLTLSFEELQYQYEEPSGCPLSPFFADEIGDPDEPDEQFLPDDAAGEYLFFFKGVFSRRLYRTQLRPKEYCTKNVGGNTLDEVFESIWRVAVKQIVRQVIFVGENANWADQDKPEIDAMEQFVTLQDPSKKKTYSISSVTQRVMSTWRDKIIKIHVYVYSTNVETNAQHRTVVRTLITPQNPDRAGADSTRDDAALAENLRKSHPHLEGHHSSWLLWANYIHSSSAQDRQRLKEAEAPPTELAKYFRWAAVSEAARLQAVHRGMTVAQTANDGWSREVNELKKDISLTLSVLQKVSHRVDAMVARATVGSELFEAMGSAMQPEEAELSHLLAAKVTDCADTDHQ
ncbi:uncharacterized protein LOC134215537 [Armigeres subalbatus]|uniref:uncharacterized protein LOC134215537 n=1 Tax=Armigeres subalbatus TaxID=124917 RepID=UPI002ED50810